MKRVVVTGMAGITALGQDWPAIEARLRANASGIRHMPEWDRYPELKTRLGGAIDDFTPPPHFTRKRTRAMGRVALLATASADAALADAGLAGDAQIQDGRMGVACGSSTGSPDATADLAYLLLSGSMARVNATSYLRMMSQTTAVNIGVFLGLKGRVIPTASACTSGSQAIGAAFEAIRYGKQALMLAGGAEELCATEAAVFDVLAATSTRNDAPAANPRPFDAARDGLVVGEGAATLVLEDLDYAQARGARILAEVCGYGGNSDGAHLTQPAPATMAQAMRLALADAGLDAGAIDYVCAHATATDTGDVAESQATLAVLGARVPVSSLKGHLGHTLGACGAIESWWTIAMLRAGWFAPTLNLRDVDPRCAALDYIVGDGRRADGEYAMNNNFAFGGINTSLIFRRWTQ